MFFFRYESHAADEYSKRDMQRVLYAINFVLISAWYSIDFNNPRTRMALFMMACMWPSHFRFLFKVTPGIEVRWLPWWHVCSKNNLPARKTPSCRYQQTSHSTCQHLTSSSISPPNSPGVLYHSGIWWCQLHSSKGSAWWHHLRKGVFPTNICNNVVDIKQKKWRPRKTDPWGTPDVTSRGFDDILFITTYCCLFFKKFSIQLTICSGILNLCNLSINALCET